jgi:hypothetical protein
MINMKRGSKENRIAMDIQRMRAIKKSVIDELLMSGDFCQYCEKELQKRLDWLAKQLKEVT